MTDVLDTIIPDDPAEDAATPPEAENWRLEKAGDTLTLWLDLKDTGTNVISEAVLRELDALVAHVEAVQPKTLVLRSAKPGGFAAGADIDGFSGLEREAAEEMLTEGHRVLDRLEALPMTTVAVIHGATLGGGFELALACDYRIGIEGVKTGFPEVQLGLHPGLGGTFRLPALIDPVEAMQMMLTGKSAHDRKAKKLGIVDDLVPDRHVDAAVEAAARGKVDRDTNLRAGAMRTGVARSIAASRMRSETEKQAPKADYPAPHALIDLWADHGGDRNAMQKGEIASFARLLETETARNLIRVFFLRRKLKEGGKGDDGIDHVHVIGAGAMGAEIAAWSAMQGKRVTLEDVALEPLGAAVKRASKIYQKKHLSGIDARDALDRMMPDPSGLGRSRADLVIEAVPEKPELKEKIYAGLKGKLKPGAILASNTSSLKLSDLVDGVSAPTRFAGLHFFNPVSQMPLVEVVSHDRADKKVLDRLAAFVAGIDRLPARVTDYPGFLVNRVLAPYLMEAMALLDEGKSKEEIDRAALAFGMPMGPVTLADQVGLDICLEVAKSMRRDLDRPVADTPDWLAEKVDKGETGKKAGKGLYDYDSDEPPETGEADTEIADRLILPMCDAAVECLRNGVAPDADTIDGAVIFGTGWAPFRGGPLTYARTRGDVPKVLSSLADTHGPRFQPDAGWSDFG
ncbi:3-hydroxyacyl-CoA dehydrogenase NAD-binding domain-containing protein [Maritimibacter sp. UBA3975]|uniref:3-hydroxyacyl-CoA dehydrogenase NAD-binding domain-containing protein n=1 Tax=Maritimibacter sp. UBA3975 TaxID=1946833 RepID=UPI000C0A7829|nr:3-hydroxyacyl-CoA dehydrogenase NAD-binding domain-containing protein [Maritimibacter sp. UBA3975]MAM60216.1 fatty-acid oxidation protein subunit alpha [Maritimibacter sp.]|tara:strand:+ start:1133 stop:3187 length:2055 start_codon:yes stop_codon:yes gene_type:complete